MVPCRARGNRTYHTCKKCIYEQFALEYVLWDHFQSSCARTEDPSQADFFYLPIIRDIDYRIALSKNGDRTPSPIESALLDGVLNNYAAINANQTIITETLIWLPYIHLSTTTKLPKVYTYIHTYIHTYVSAYIYIYHTYNHNTCIHSYIHAYISTYIHTYIHTYINTHVCSLAMERGDTNGWLRVFNVTDRYWKARGGADHVIAMPAPVTNFRHQSNMRGFFHYVSAYVLAYA